MRPVLAPLTVLALGILCGAVCGQEPKVAQPKVVAPPGSALSRLEEEVETLEAQREIKKAYVKAAELEIKIAEVELKRVNHAIRVGVARQEEADRPILDIELARAKLEIRTAEMKEVEVKIKYARRRLDDAKASVQPPPPPGK